MVSVLSACEDPSKPMEESIVISTVLDSLCTAYDIPGAVLVYDPKSKTYYTNDSSYARQRTLPASTFKIPNTIIGLETDVIDADTTIFRWDSIVRNMSQWNTDLNLQQALTYSCVPCYQQVARDVGIEKMRQMLDRIAYPGMVFDSNSLDQFWLTGPSSINLFEQIDFMQRLHEGKLPIAKKTSDKVLQLLTNADSTATYQLKAKTGWAYQDNRNIGWYVGLVEAKGSVHYFATRISPNIEAEITTFLPVRKELTVQALQKLNIIN